MSDGVECEGRHLVVGDKIRAFGNDHQVTHIDSDGDRRFGGSMLLINEPDLVELIERDGKTIDWNGTCQKCGTDILPEGICLELSAPGSYWNIYHLSCSFHKDSHHGDSHDCKLFRVHKLWSNEFMNSMTIEKNKVGDTVKRKDVPLNAKFKYKGRDHVITNYKDKLVDNDRLDMDCIILSLPEDIKFIVGQIVLREELPDGTLFCHPGHVQTTYTAMSFSNYVTENNGKATYPSDSLMCKDEDGFFTFTMQGSDVQILRLPSGYSQDADKVEADTKNELIRIDAAERIAKEEFAARERMQPAHNWPEAADEYFTRIVLGNYKRP